MPQTKNMEYSTKSPVLFIIFNRTDTSLLVFEQIRRARPSKLYIAADGYRRDRPEEEEKCTETKNAIVAAINWPCELKTLFRTENLGPKEAIASSIDWFFEHEEEGIILEHDCLPANSFFRFCDTLLEKYRNDTRVWLISGCNLQNGKKWGKATYYFSNLTNGWGWATWKSSWDTYDKNLKDFDRDEVKVELQKIFDHPLIVEEWVRLFEETKSGKIATWDYQVTFAHLFSHRVNIVPNENLVSNIGFGELSENTFDETSIFASVPLQEINEIIHPKFMVPEKFADLYTLEEGMSIKRIELQRKKHNSIRRRFKRWIKMLFS